MEVRSVLLPLIEKHRKRNSAQVGREVVAVAAAVAAVVGVVVVVVVVPGSGLTQLLPPITTAIRMHTMVVVVVDPPRMC